ncbi:MAG: FeoB-associated Cys-rich membrane protein [Cellvibrio sp.]
MWQEIIVGVCVIAAFFFLARRWLPFFKKKTVGCDTGCGGCSSSTTSCSKEKVSH